MKKTRSVAFVATVSVLTANAFAARAQTELMARANFGDGYRLAAGAAFGQDGPLLQADGTVGVALTTAQADQSGFWSSHGNVIYVAHNDDLVTSATYFADGTLIFDTLNGAGMSDGVFTIKPVAVGASAPQAQLLFAPSDFTVEGNEIVGYDQFQRFKDGRIGFRATDANGGHAYQLRKGDVTQTLARETELDATSPYAYLFAPAASPSGLFAGKVWLGANQPAVVTWTLDGESRQLPIGAPDLDNGLGVSSDGHYLALVADLANGARAVLLWDGLSMHELARSGTATLAKIAYFDAHVNRRGQVVFRGTSPDGKRAIFAANLDAQGIPVITRVVTEHDIVMTDLGEAQIGQENTTDEVFTGDVALNDAGQIAFIAALTPQGDDQTEWGDGLFRAQLP